MTFESSGGSMGGSGMGGSSGGMGGRRTITAFFDDRTEADRAVQRLYDEGFSRSEVRIVAGSSGSTGSTTTTTTTEQSRGGGGFFDALADLFLPDEDRHTYAEGLNRGGFLVTVTTSGGNYERALDILDDEGTVDIDERASTWRSEGWTGGAGSSSSSSYGTSSTGGMGSGIAGMAAGAAGMAAGASGMGSGTSGMGSGSSGMGSSGMASSGMTGAGSTGSTTGSSYSAGTARGTTGAEEVIPVAEEQLRVGKREVNQGRVRVRSYVVETPVSEQVNLREERATIERRSVDRPLTGSENLFQDRTIEVEERAEEAVVSKEARVREEIVVGKEVEQRTETVSDTLRSTEVEVEDDRGTLTGGTSRTGGSTTGGTTTGGTSTDRNRSGF